MSKFNMDLPGSTTPTYNFNANLVGVASLLPNVNPVTFAAFEHYPCPAGGTTLIFGGFQFKDSLGAVHTFHKVISATGSVPLNVPVVDSAGCYSTSTISTTDDGSGYILNVSDTHYGLPIPYDLLTFDVYDMAGNDIHALACSPVQRNNPACQNGQVSVTDPNGNKISAASNQAVPLAITWTDILGQTALSFANAYTPSGFCASPPCFSTYTYADATGVQQSVKLDLSTTYGFVTNFACPGVNDIGTQGSNGLQEWQPLPTTVSLPDGSFFALTYEQTPGFPTTVINGQTVPATTGRIASLRFPTGGTISYSYSGPNNGLNCFDASIPTLTRTTPDGVWTYTHSPTTAASPVSTTTVTDPLGNQTVYTFSGTYETEQDVYQGSSTGGTLLLKKVTCYNTSCSNPATEASSISFSNASVTVSATNSFSVGQSVTFYNVPCCNFLNGITGVITSASGSQFTAAVPIIRPSFGPVASGAIAEIAPVPEKDVYTYLPGVSQPSVVATTYNNFGLVTEEKDFDFGGGPAVPGSLPLVDKTVTYGTLTNGTCLAISSTINDRPCSVVTKDSNGNTAAQETYSYDSAGNILADNRLVSGSIFVTKNFTYATNGMMLTSQDENGNIRTYANPTCNGLFPTSVSEGGLTYSMTWDCSGAVITSMTDPNTKVTNYQFKDPMWRLTEVDYPDGGKRTRAYNIAETPPNVTTSQLLDNAGHSITTQTNLDGLGRPSQEMLTSDPSGTVFTATTYDSVGRVDRQYNSTRCNPPTTNCGESTWGYTQFGYDGLGRVTSVTSQDGGISTTDYSSFPTVTVTDQAGIAHRSTSDGLGRLVEVDEPSAASSGFVHPFITLYKYDALGNLTCVEQHGDAASGTGCSASPSSDASSPWRVRRFTYDSLSRLLSSSNPEANTALTGTPPAQTPTRVNTTYTYDANGNLLQKTSPAPNQTGLSAQTLSYCYDALNRVTGKAYSAQTCTNGQLPTGTAVVSYTYDGGTNGIGHLTSLTDQVGSGSYSYDPMGRIASETRTINTGSPLGPVSKTMSYEYNLDGSFSKLHYPSGAIITYTPDSAGRMISAIDTGNGFNYAKSAIYGPVGITNFVSGNTGSFAGITNSFSYNNRLQPVNMSGLLPSSSVVTPVAVANSGFETPSVGAGSFLYNPSGGNWSFAGSSGVSSNNSGFTSGNPAAPEGSQVAFLQMGSGSVIAQTLSGFTAGASYTVSFQAAQRGNCCGNGGQDFDLYLDSTLLGTFRPTSTSYSTFSTPPFTTSGSSHTLSFVGRDSSGGDNTAFIDAVQVTWTGAGPPVFNLNYDFHLGTGDNGNVFALNNNKDTTRNQTFTYDQLNRLISAQNAGTDCTINLPDTNSKFWGNSYGYDAWGNLLTKNITKCASEFLSVTAQANNQLVGFGYDAAGNMVSSPAPNQATSTFDAENRMTASNFGGVTATYAYDGDGNRVEKSNGTTGTLYWYMTPGVVAESDLNGNLQSEYIFFNGERVARKDFPSNAVSYYFSDHLKTTDVVTDAQGNILNESDYYAWGGELHFVANDSNHYKFTGKERDDNETGLDYFGARYYSQALGRFITPDPSMGSVKLRNPQSWNRYSYTINSPLRYIDPTGELWVATTNLFSPFQWVESCRESQTCYESVSVVSGNNLVIYGSTSRNDVTSVAANKDGYVDLTDVAAQHDANFELKKGASPYVSLKTASDFFNTTEEYHEENPDSAKFVVTDAGKANGDPLPPHKTHDLGRSVDLRYQDEYGKNLQGNTAADNADTEKTKRLVDIAKSAGFNQNYSARPEDFGTQYAPGHKNHLHLGKTRPPNK